MIVSCPGCQTLYRDRESGADRAALATCSRCDATVPLSAVRPSYVVRAVGRRSQYVPARRIAFGMDHPALAADLGRTALDIPGGSSGAALTYRLMSPEPVEARPTSPPVREPLEANPFVAPADPVLTEEVADAIPSHENPDAAEPLRAEESPSEAASSARRPMLELFVSLLLAAAGAAAGYHAARAGFVQALEVHASVAPVEAHWLGGLLGLFLGWMAVRWMSRER